MITKDVKAMISYAFSYADEIGWKKNGTYPRDAKLTLRNQVKDDMLVFLGYIYDEDSSDPDRQIAFLNDSLQIVINYQNFMRFREDKCSSSDILNRVPLSLTYFVRDDTSPYSRRGGYGISLSKYLVNTFNDVGCYFISFGGISNYEQERLSNYIGMLNNYLNENGLMDPGTSYRFRESQAERDREYERLKERYRAAHEKPIRNNDGGIFGFMASPPKKKDSFTPYTSSQADLDVAKMMHDYKQKNADRGIVFDDSMLHSTPSGNVDTSMGMSGNEAVSGMQEANESTENRESNSTETLDMLLDELNSLIGLTEVKKNIHNLINLVKVKKMREDMGLKTPDMSLHLVFSGNPGTGKTTVARLLAKIYHLLGVVSKGQLIEVDRAGLVEGYVGQTAIKTAEVCDSAKGGILFIDEAYTLTQSEGQDFGQEAVDTILKRMEDDRADFVVIAAGYTKQMEEFVDSNPGLKSRFNKFIEFPDYTGEELFEIFCSMCVSQDYLMNSEAKVYVRDFLEKMSESYDENFANAREARNYFERCVERQASRVVNETTIDENSLTTLKIEDVTE